MAIGADIMAAIDTVMSADRPIMVVHTGVDTAATEPDQGVLSQPGILLERNSGMRSSSQ